MLLGVLIFIFPSRRGRPKCILVANHEKEDWINGEKTEDVVAFLDRLYTAKRKVEQRIVVLGGEDDLVRQPYLSMNNNSQSGVQRPTPYQDTGPKSGLSLRDVLRNPSSLSYFMEFMDRRHRSLLVQFWLTVESFKNPLESVDSGSSDDEDDPIQDPTTSITVKEDISMINDLYFSNSSPHPALASISDKHVDIIRDFTRNELTPSPARQRRVRRSVMLAQREVERNMEQDFEDFERSELWFRVIGDTDFGNRNVPSDAFPTLRDRHSTSNPPPTFLSSSSTFRHSHSPTPQILPHSESSPGLPILRTASSNSNRSSRSSSSTPAAPRVPPTNIEVLMSPDPSSASSRAPLFDDPEDEAQRAEERRMEAIQAALTDIIALEQQQTEKAPSGREANRSRGRSTHSQAAQTTDSRKRRAVFDDDIDDEVDDADEDRPQESGDGHGSFQLAAPGDLQLSYEITRLGDNIANLQAQDAMLDTLIKKAELTGDTQELRLLTKSKSSMNRELRELRFQKLQYEQQESANRLFSDRTKVSIVSSTVGDEEGKSVVRYLIEVQQLASDGSFASGWVVARRYNEFLNMHNKLREHYGLVRSLDFPGKRLVTALSGSFVDTRRTALEKYLQVCRA